MVNAVRKSDAASAHAAAAAGLPAKRPPKIAVYLVTEDEALWPTIGAGLERNLALQQVDSIDELHKAMQTGQAAIVLWDAREQKDRLGGLSRLQVHSPRSVCIAIDTVARADTWKSALKQRQIAALLHTPVEEARLALAMTAARDEYLARAALLGDSDGSRAGEPPSADRAKSRRGPWIPLAAGAGLLCVAVAAYFWHRAPPANDAPAVPDAPAAGPAAPSPATTGASTPAAAGPIANSGNDEKVDILIEKARAAMQDRRFIEPADGNALAYYRDALLFDPANGEARQGLQRLAQILLARVQSSLDERKFDQALQYLETARSISPGDARLAALDAKVASLRSELGPTQIQAALNAKNFDRAAQLLDEAGRAKTLSGAKLAQLREEVRRRRAESDVAQLTRLIDARLQQDRLIEPRDDSAAFYLQQARQAGASPADLEPQTTMYVERLLTATHAAIEQRRLADADRMLAEARAYGAAAPALAGLQQDLAAARTAQTKQKADLQQLLSETQTRLDQNALTEPANDSALTYAAQLHTSDAKNAQAAALVTAVQNRILDRARAALDAGDAARAEGLLSAAGTLGAAPALTALGEKLAQLQQLQAAAPKPATAPLVMTKPLSLDYPRDAERRGTEGWVDLAFTVTADGGVANVVVLGSTPANVFDAAARSAMQRVRYQPVIKDGRPIEVTSKVRVVFKLGQR